MLVRNATVYIINNLAAADLIAAIAAKPFQPPGGMDSETMGWAAPIKSHPDELTRSVGNVVLFCLRRDAKILPASVVTAEAEARAQEIAEREGRPIGRKEMRELKERVTEELLPKAFIRTTRIHAWIDFDNNLLVVDSASAAKADDVLLALNKTLPDGLDVVLWGVNNSVTVAMSAWVQSGEHPDGFSVDDRALLLGEDEARVRVSKQSLDSADIRALAEHKTCVELAMTWGQRVSIVLTKALAMKRICFLDIQSIENESQVEMLPEERYDAEILLSAKEVAGLVGALEGVLGGRKA